MQTGYLGINAFSYALPFNGGICQWWFTPRENIAAWYPVDPQTQFLTDEPFLKDGTTWYGPIKVPDGQLGYEEPIKRNTAGIFYNQKVSGFHPGDDAFSRVNLSNMPYHEYVIIGLQRAGGFFVVFGNAENGLSFDPEFTSGEGNKNVAGTKFAFSMQSPVPAQVLLSFSQSPSTPPPGWQTPGTTTDADGNTTEIITFTSADSTKTIDWDADRLALFGSFPLIQVWSINEDDESVELISVPIKADAAAPAQTLFTIYTPGLNGFIVIK